MSKLDNIFFSIGISILILSIFFIFLFFGSKKINESESLQFIGNLTLEQTQEKTLSLMEEGDIILTKPKSLTDSYLYELERKGKITNPIKTFFWYNLFDKILISSMGDTYWHSGIYIGNETMNSIYFSGIYKDKLDENFFKYRYFKVLKVKTSEDNKRLAIERSDEHFKNQDVYYSLKNGLLTVFLESTASKRELNIKENELVCSSYIGSIYREVKFNNKPFTHLTPVALEFSDKTETKFLVNQTGFYIENE